MPDFADRLGLLHRLGSVSSKLRSAMTYILRRGEPDDVPHFFSDHSHLLKVDESVVYARVVTQLYKCQVLLDYWEYRYLCNIEQHLYTLHRLTR